MIFRLVLLVAISLATACALKLGYEIEFHPQIEVTDDRKED